MFNTDVNRRKVRTMSETQDNNVVQMNAVALPEDTSQALRILIRFSEQLVQLADRETQALVQNDMRSFAILQDDKEKISLQYAGAAKEFHERLNEFRGADPGLLQRLEDLQHELGEKTKSNTKIVERIFKDAQKGVHSNLLSVQELAQVKPFKDAPQQETKKKKD